MTKGFSLIELVAVIAILAIVAATILPRIARRRVPAQENMLRNLNTLTRTAQLNAMMSGKLHRIMFDFSSEKMGVEIASDKKDSQGSVIFVPLNIHYMKTSVAIPKNFEIEQFSIKGKNMLQQGAGITATSAWFYIVPDGMSQEVTMEFNDTERVRKFVFNLNPFTATFKVV